MGDQVHLIEREFNTFYDNITCLIGFDIYGQYLKKDNSKIVCIPRNNSLNRFFRLKHHQIYKFLKSLFFEYGLFIERVIRCDDIYNETYIRICSLLARQLEGLITSLGKIQSYYGRKNFNNISYVQISQFSKRKCADFSNYHVDLTKQLDASLTI